MRATTILTGRPARSHMHSPILRQNIFRLIGILVVIWGELGFFYWSLRNCRWPSFDSTQNAAENPPEAVHVLLLSDTQVKSSALPPPYEGWFSGLRRYLCDLNLRKSWHVTSKMNPDAIIFLGDMISNGKQAKDEANYAKAVEKFKKIFATRNGVATYYVPGNNDISMGELTPVSKRIRGYFSDSFGPLQQTFDINNHTFVALNAPGVVDEDYQRTGQSVSFTKWTAIANGPFAFVEEVASTRSTGQDKPLILLSHIPLARPEMASCGPLREKGTLRRNVGHGYQSMLGRQTSVFLLKKLQPAAIFSGDNRDYCDYMHANVDNPHSIREVTLKSFSMSVHVRRPGFQLLSIMDPGAGESILNTPKTTITDTPCFLPDQSKIYTSFYAPLFFLALVVLFTLNYSRARARRSAKSGYRSTQPPPIRIIRTSSGSSNERTSPINMKWSALPWTPTWSSHTPNTPAPPLNPRITTSNELPGVLRTPHASSNSFSDPPAFRASSRSGTPVPALVAESPFGGRFGMREEDEDPMQSSQYVTRRETGQRRYQDTQDMRDEEWADVSATSARIVTSRSVSSMTLPDSEDDYDLVDAMSESKESLLPSSSSQSFSRHNRRFSEFISSPDIGKRSSTGMGVMERERRWSWSFVLGGRRRRISLRLPSLSSLEDAFSFVHGSTSGPHKRRTSVLFDTVMDMCRVSWPGVVAWCIIAWSLH